VVKKKSERAAASTNIGIVSSKCYRRLALPLYSTPFAPTQKGAGNAGILNSPPLTLTTVRPYTRRVMQNTHGTGTSVPYSSRKEREARTNFMGEQGA
jgi:hypothetical protein